MTEKLPALSKCLHQGIVLALLLLLLFSTSLVWAQKTEHPPVPQSINELEQAVQDILDQYNIPGAGLSLVTPDGEQTFAFGIADRDSNSPVTRETRFRIGSISKTFVALSALQLVEAGKLNLDDRLADIAPEIEFENRWEETHPVRLVNLLEHTAGFSDLHLSDFAINAPEISLKDGLATLSKSMSANWSPDRYFLYSSAGTSAAAYMVEQTSGQVFEDYVQQHIFNLLGMPNATYFYPADNEIATSYNLDGQTPVEYIHIIVRPAGSVSATPEDMAHLLQFFLGRGAYQGKTLLRSASIERMETPATTLAAQNGATLGYGLCNMTTVQDGFVFHGHNGAVDGFLADYGYLPESGVGYFLAINAPNSAAFQELAWLLRAYLTKDLSAPAQPAPVKVQDLSQYAGFFIPAVPQMSKWSFPIERIVGILQLQPETDRLLVKPVLGAPFELTPMGSGLFYTPDAPAADTALSHDEDGQMVLQTRNANYIFLPAWQAWLLLGLAVITNLFILSVGLYALVWLPMWRLRKLRLGRGMMLRILPLLALLSMIGFNGLLVASLVQPMGKAVHLLGTASAWAISISILTVLFALFSLATLVQSLRTLRCPEIAAPLRIYTLLVSLSLGIVTIYLARYGLIGLMTWK